MRPKTVALISVVLMSQVQESPAKTPPPAKIEDVVRILRAHRDPVAEDFKKVGSDVDSALVEIVTSSKAGDELRVRAARALGRFPGPRAEGVLATIIASRETPLEIRAAAMTGLARVKGGAAVTDLKPYLFDPAPKLRAGAAKALGETNSEVAHELLLSALEHESVLEVRQAIDKALKRLGQ